MEMSQPHPQTSLINSDRVAGTKVYGADNQHIGSIDSLEIEKVSGRVVFANMTFGGFLGMGEKSYAIPWGVLKYDTELVGYRTNLTKQLVEGAPAYPESEPRDFRDPKWNESVHRYYDVPPYL